MLMSNVLKLAGVFKNFLLFIAAAVIFILITLLNPINASAADGSNASGASLPQYSSVTEVSVLDYSADKTGKNDSASAIQKALNVGKTQASDTNRVVVRIPAGTYKISKSLKIYSNTQLIIDDGATIIKCFSKGCMIKNARTYGGGGYESDRNIVIDGGVWDGNTSEYNSVYSFSNFRIGHAKNIILRNIDVRNNKNGHLFEIGGTKNLTVDGCSFSGYTGSLLKEAIQLDVMHSTELFAGFEPFDDTPCENVIIQNCSFKNMPRAIGSHSAVVGTYYTNITIKNNTFDNMWDIAMVLYNYKNCTVSGNTITNSGAGITFNYMSDESFRHYFCPLVGKSAAKANISDDADTVIENNSITTVQTSLRSDCYALKLYGKYVSSDASDYPAYNYRIKNVRISANTIKTVGKAITMNNVYGSSIKDNDISVNTDESCVEADLVSLTYCSNIAFRGNKVGGSFQSGLRASNTDSLTVSGNSFSDNVVCGVIVSSVTDTSVSKNTLKGSGKGAVKVSDGSSDVTVSGNVIKSFSNYGVQISGSGSGGEDITVKSNDFSGGNVGISCVDGAAAYLNRNSFEAVTDKVYADSEGGITLAQPQDFTAEEITDNRIKLTWTAVGEADEIGVFRRRAGAEDYELIATLDSGAIYQDEKLVSGTNYFYKIVPYIDIGDVRYENTVSPEIQARTKINIESAYIDCVSAAGFTSRPVTPKITIVANNRKLTAGADYDCTYSNNLYIGTATVTVTGRGNYIGTLTYNFDITLGDRRISNAAATPAYSGTAFSAESGRTYIVKCTPTSGMLLADSDETLNFAERSINAARVRVPVETTVTTGIWTESGYEYIG